MSETRQEERRMAARPMLACTTIYRTLAGRRGLWITWDTVPLRRDARRRLREVAGARPPGFLAVRPDLRLIKIWRLTIYFLGAAP